MGAEVVAKIAYNGLLKNKRLIIPGFKNKIAIFISNLLPGNILAYVVKRIQKKFTKKINYTNYKKIN